MNKQIDDISCKRCVHYEVCRFVNALAVANVVNAENCRMFRDTKSYRKSTDVAAEIFAEIKRKRQEYWNKGKYTMFQCWYMAEEDVRKKYTESGD